jgi:hypothetical protein
MNIHNFRKLIDIIDDNEPSYSDKEVTVKMCNINNIAGSTPSSRVINVCSGFDWDGWQILICTQDKLFKKEN